MRILIDADACPDIDIIEEIGKENNIEVIIISDFTHHFANEYAKIITLSKESQSVDIFIMNEIKEKDILITQDIGLASIALKKTSNVINTKGQIFKESEIERLLFERFLNQKSRKIGYSTKHRKRSYEDTENLVNKLLDIIE